MICLNHSPTVINRALRVFSSIISQRLNETSQEKAGRAVHRFLVIHWFPSFHPRLLCYWTSLHSKVCAAAVSNVLCKRDPPAPHSLSTGEQWQHQRCPTNTPSASRWPIGLSEEHLSLSGVLCILLQKASMPVATSLVLLLWPERPLPSVCLRNKGIDHQLKLSPTKASCKIRKYKF